MTKMVAGISKAAIEREAAMMEASSNFIWAGKIRALRAALDKAEAERDRLAAAVDAVMADRARIIGERDRLRLYAGHDDDCTINRYPATSACSCGLRAAFPDTPSERTCPSCRDSLDLPSGDGCAIMTAHEPNDPRVRLDADPDRLREERDERVRLAQEHGA